MKSWLRSSFGLAEEKVVVTLPQLRAMSAEGDDRAVRGLMMAVPENRRLLYVGSDHAYKNVECACEAARRVQEIYPDTRLFVTLPFDHPLCDGKVILGLGYLRGSALRAAYELATVFVMPSLVECGNLTVLEAMSFGTPVLVADRPYARDTCEDAAVFFDPLRSEGLATQIVCLLGDVRQRTKMVDLGGALVERRQRGASYSTMISHLVSLAGRSGTPSGVTAEPEGRLRWRADL
jgi:glycosyltransferase involved in cell wall biosynthesis